MTLAACTVGTDSVGEPVLSVASAPGAEGAALDASSLDVSGFDRVLSGDVVLSEGFDVPQGEVWALDPTKTTRVEVGGNVIVRGTLVMRPSSREVVHTLRFGGIDESVFVGGGMEPLSTDVGLWVVGDGVLDLQGTPTTAWSYEWQPEWVDAEVVAAPHMPGDYEGFKAVNGPDSVSAPNPLGFAPELLNLTRNVRVEGTPAGRTHIFIHSTRPQVIRFASIRYVAPDLQDLSIRDRDQDETGRYGIHFHHNGEASRGSLVEGVVVRDAGNHAFVPHGSHGITFRDTIAFNTLNAAYWWDPTSQRKPGTPPTTHSTITPWRRWFERPAAATLRSRWVRARTTSWLIPWRSAFRPRGPTTQGSAGREPSRVRGASAAIPRTTTLATGYSYGRTQERPM